MDYIPAVTSVFQYPHCLGPLEPAQSLCLAVWLLRVGQQKQQGVSYQVTRVGPLPDFARSFGWASCKGDRQQLQNSRQVAHDSGACPVASWFGHLFQPRSLQSTGHKAKHRLHLPLSQRIAKKGLMPRLLKSSFCGTHACTTETP